MHVVWFQCERPEFKNYLQQLILGSTIYRDQNKTKKYPRLDKEHQASTYATLNYGSPNGQRVHLWAKSKRNHTRPSNLDYIIKFRPLGSILILTPHRSPRLWSGEFLSRILTVDHDNNADKRVFKTFKLGEQ